MSASKRGITAARPRRRHRWSLRWLRRRRARLPAGVFPDNRGLPPDNPPDDPSGGAGVREPRRPRPSAPAASAAREEPREDHVDTTSELRA